MAWRRMVVHGLGLKFGVYSDAGTKTCQGRPGSLTFEKIDAQSYASWGAYPPPVLGMCCGPFLIRVARDRVRCGLPEV